MGKSKSSKEKETVAPHIVKNPGDRSVVRGERVFLECEAEPRSSVKSCSWRKSGSELSMDSRHWLEGCSLVIDPVQGSGEVSAGEGERGGENPQTVQAAYREGRGEGGKSSQKTDPASANK